MNKIYIVLIVLGISLMISCSKTDDADPSNVFVTKGKTFELSNGFISGGSEGKYRILLGDGLYDTINQKAGSSGITFVFKSPEDSSLAGGAYIFSVQEELRNREFSGRIYMYDNAFFNVDSGSVVINTSAGSAWKMDIKLGYNNIQSLTGLYEGSLVTLEESLLPVE